MQEMLRNQDRAIANIENIPGGFQHLTSLISTLNGVDTAGVDPSTGNHS
jgi:hypothetical protein